MGAPGRVTLMQRATPPQAPLESVPWKYLMLSMLASLCLPFGVAALWERSVQRISSAEELEQQTELTVVGEVSKLPLRRRYAVNGTTRENGRDMGLFEESIDSLRTGLVLPEERQDVQVLAVASAISGEGKTSVASQLAVSIARSSGKPTLLIDADMRAPDIHRIFQIEKEPGLAQVLNGGCTLEDAIVTTWSDHVHLLPAGELHESPHKLMGSDAFKALIDEARLWYRYVIIDTPPVLSASESLVIAKHADGTLICTMRDISRASHFRLAYDRLIATGSRPVGAVLNGVPVRRYASTYGSYGYSR
jgi:capsular exopolysaccharide synthesis family protein